MSVETVEGYVLYYIMLKEIVRINYEPADSDYPGKSPF